MLVIFPQRTFLILLLGDYSHSHAGWGGEFTSTGQAANLKWTEVTLQGVLQSYVSLLSLFLLLGALPRPVIHLEPHHFTARTRRATKEQSNVRNNTEKLVLFFLNAKTPFTINATDQPSIIQCISVDNHACVLSYPAPDRAVDTEGDCGGVPPISFPYGPADGGVGEDRMLMLPPIASSESTAKWGGKIILCTKLCEMKRWNIYTF